MTQATTRACVTSRTIAAEHIQPFNLRADGSSFCFFNFLKFERA
jgi:hypothetical protein